MTGLGAELPPMADGLCDEPTLPLLPGLVTSSARPNCEVCFGTGLVCEDHPLRPWDSGAPADCDCGAAGMPCVCTGLISGVAA